jgi:hypothetical protein
MTPYDAIRRCDRYSGCAALFAEKRPAACAAGVRVNYADRNGSNFGIRVPVRTGSRGVSTPKHGPKMSTGSSENVLLK